ncbi:MAG: hypothetical protein SWH68_09020 [Thermodesulfobacteriota bacterium]|nr:hypothetical protein [Thermodesulfobacteriota bacterium]
MDQQERYYEDEIELIDILRVIWRWKWFLVLVAAIVVGITFAVVMMLYPARTGSAAILSLSFPGIEKGQNPDGTPFSPDQLIAPLVINRAVERLKNIEKNQVLANWRDVVSVTPIVPDDVKEAEDFFPTKFKLLVYSQTRDGETVFSERFLTEDFLLAIIDVYKTMFERRYIETFLVSSKLMIEEMTPLEAIDVIKKKTGQLRSEIDELEGEAVRYKSKTENVSLNDVAHEVGIFNDILLKNATAQVLPQFYNNAFVKEHNILSRKIEKAQAEASATRDMLNQLIHENMEKQAEDNKGKQAEGVILDSQALEYYSRMDVRKYLVEKAINAEVEVEHLRVDLASLQADYEIANPGELPPAIVKLQNRLISLCDRANATYSEYMKESLDGTIRQVTDIMDVEAREANLVLSVALAGVASIFIAIFLAFFFEYINNSKYRRAKP